MKVKLENRTAEYLDVDGIEDFDVPNAHTQRSVFEILDCPNIAC